MGSIVAVVVGEYEEDRCSVGQQPQLADLLTASDTNISPNEDAREIAFQVEKEGTTKKEEEVEEEDSFMSLRQLYDIGVDISGVVGVVVGDSVTTGSCYILHYLCPQHKHEVTCPDTVCTAQQQQHDRCTYSHGVAVRAEDILLAKWNDYMQPNRYVLFPLSSSSIWSTAVITHILPPPLNSSLPSSVGLRHEQHNESRLMHQVFPLLSSPACSSILSSILSSLSSCSAFWTELPLPPPPAPVASSFCSMHATPSLPAEDDEVRPLLCDDECSSSNEEDIEVGAVGRQRSMFLSMVEDIHRNGRRKGDNHFGSWMRHTSGLGLKMLQKYGYEIGTPIGRNRPHGALVNPIPIVVHPQRKSLDFIAAAKAKRKVRESGGDRQTSGGDGSKIGRRRKGEKAKEASMFALLNEVSMQSSVVDRGGGGDSSTEGCHDEQMRKLRKACVDEVDLRKQILICEQKIREVGEQAKHAEDNLNRHKGVGGVSQLVLVYSQQVTTTRDQLRRLQEQYSLLAHKVQGVKNNKKLTKF
eukprot:GHVS01105961.1.p1 GENE.GHVS01105961.1~~GHVS01105961.1.p1  ORF type:complete len:555 (+),score=160.54 GHVS01105961.1:87-1667(+)